MNDKHKKILRLVLLGGILLLAIGCGLASCKKANAYDQMQVSDGLDSPNHYSGILIGYSLDLGDIYGNNLTANQGDDFFDLMNELGYNLDNTNTYLFHNTSTNYPILGINFYYTLVNGNPTQLNVQFFSFEENTIMYSITHTYDYYTCYNKFLMVYWRPFTHYVDYTIYEYNEMTYENTPVRFTQYGTYQTIPIYDEIYWGEGYDESQSQENMYFRYMRTNLHSNEILYLSNVEPTQTMAYYVSVYNQALTYRYNYYNDLRITGYRGGYNQGYIDGGSSSTETAYQNGYQKGYLKGKEDGYDDGAQGNNAVSSAINVLSSIFGAIGAIFSIELFPHITLGLFLLVPLFFGVLGLILWIWRHN